MKHEFKRAESSYMQNFCDIEARAQTLWRQENTYHSPDVPQADNKRYILGMFPYPSGNAHMGHVRVYSITDIIARHARFKGHDVLHPLGWDSFGLPAENAAIKNNVHPADWTNTNIKTMRDEQIGQVGFSFDLDRELITSSPEYYKWTQWLFLKLYEHDKVYRSLEWVNWDPVDQTVLANEQVIDGKGWRSGAQVERRQMEQWYIRITDYAEELAQEIENLNGWSEAAKGAQRNWIGRSEGALLHFQIDGSDKIIKAFTTQPELSFGISAIVIAPENDSIPELCQDQQKQAVTDYIKQAMLRSEVERASNKNVDGVFTGTYATNPVSGEKLPVYVADYVLNTYANGVAVCVPAHNEKDHSFAEKMNLPVKPVLSSASQTMPSCDENGTIENSSFLDGMTVSEARDAVLKHLADHDRGGHKVEYRLRDWSLSRQRFWGSPIPMLKSQEGTWKPVPENELPVKLPHDVDFSTTQGKSPLATHPDFHQVEAPDTGALYERAIDTMDTFMCSAWYAWRFTDPKNSKQAWNPELGNAWMPIDTYVGGLEHANQHMIYFRFMSHFLHDIGLTASKEPIRCFLDNGLVRLHGDKMSKSKGNIVRPDEMVEKFGADALRMYILSDIPFNRDIDWNEDGIKGKFDFLKRIHAAFTSYAVKAPKGIITITPDDVTDEWSADILRTLRDIADKIDNDIEKSYAFHNVVAKTHELANKLLTEQDQTSTPERKKVYAYAMQSFLKVLGLTAPHLSDVLFRETFKADQGLFSQPWINIDQACLVSSCPDVQVALMINGKKRGTQSIPTDANDDEIRIIVTSSTENNLVNAFTNATLDKLVVVRDNKTQQPKLINVVTRKMD